MVDTVKSDWHKVASQGSQQRVRVSGDGMVDTSVQRRAQGCLGAAEGQGNVFPLDPLGRQPC